METERLGLPRRLPPVTSDAWYRKGQLFKVLQSNKLGEMLNRHLKQGLRAFNVLMWLVICQDKDDVVMRCLSNLFGHRTLSAKAGFE